MASDVLQRATVVTVWSRERGREPSLVIDEDGARYEYREIKVQNGVLQAIDPSAEDIIKAPLGSSTFTVEVGEEETPLYVSDSGSRSDFGKVYLVEDRLNRVNYRAHVGDNSVKLVNQSNDRETEFSIY